MSDFGDNKNQFFHDVRNGLAAIRLNAQFIEKMVQSGNEQPEVLLERARKILSNVDRIAAHISNAEDKPKSNED